MTRTGCYFLFIFFMFHVSQLRGAVPSVKVLIAKSLNKVVVEGTNLKKTIHTKKKESKYSGKKKIRFNCHLQSKKNQKFSSSDSLLVASLKSNTGLLSWKGQKYNGEFHLLANFNKGSCDLVNHVSLETYLASLLAKEMNASWPIEALKAQAVAARTYAYERLLRHDSLENLYHLESSEKDQVSGSFFDITRRTRKATEETKGMILVGPSGKVTPAFFHSKCGGKTLRPDQVWGGREEGYRSVVCTFCQKTGKKNWNVKIKGSRLSYMIDKVLRRYYSDHLDSKNLRIVSDSSRNSELRLYDGDKLHIIKKAYLRNLTGRKVLPSNNFVVESSKGGFLLKGKGYGHGVGLCQLGALELAQRGYRFNQILSFYFPQHKLKRAY